jgi:hypothetical protein
MRVLDHSTLVNCRPKRLGIDHGRKALRQGIIGMQNVYLSCILRGTFLEEMLKRRRETSVIHVVLVKCFLNSRASASPDNLARIDGCQPQSQFVQSNVVCERTVRLLTAAQIQEIAKLSEGSRLITIRPVDSLSAWKINQALVDVEYASDSQSMLLCCYLVSSLSSSIIIIITRKEEIDQDICSCEK